MKKPNTILFVAVLLFFALTNIAAQENLFDDATLIQLKKTSEELMKNQKMRIVKVEERFTDEGKTPLGFIKTIKEIVPPDCRRVVTEENLKNRTAAKSEFIEIGDKSFVRNNNGAWEVFPVNNSVGGYGNGIGKGREEIKVEPTVVRTLTKGEKINNQTVDLYKVVTTKKYTYYQRIWSSVSTESFWFDGAGKLIRYINAETYSRTTEDYEYNPNIKIEEPIIKAKTKQK